MSQKQRNSAIFGIAMLCQQKDIAISLQDINQAFIASEQMDNAEIERVSQDLQLRAKWLELNEKNVLNLPMPALVQKQGGEYAVLLQANEEEILVQQYKAERAEKLSHQDFFAQYTDQALLLTEQEANAVQSKKFGFSWFFSTLLKYRSILKETLLASFFVQLFALVTPLFFMIIIDKVFSHNNLSTLNVLVFGMVVVAIFDVVLSAVRSYLMSHTTNRVDLELGARLFKRMMQLPLSYFESRRSGETIARMREMETIRNFLTGSSLTLFIDIFFLFVFLFVMFLFSSTLFLIVLISLPLFFLVSFFITPLMRDKLEDKHQKIAENQSFLVETLGGIETIKSSSVEPYCQRYYENKLAALSKCGFNSANLSNLIQQCTQLISKGLTIILLYTGANLVLAGELSVGQLIAFNMLTARVIQPIQRLAQIWQEFTSMKISIQRVADIMNAPTEPVMLTGRTAMQIEKGEIDIENMSFAYDAESQAIMQDINLHIPAGQVVGVIGYTGSGKTTLIKLIQRLYVPSKGRISIDGVNIASVDGSQLRRHIGVVAQDFVLFNRSIKDNIALGDKQLDDEVIIEAAKTAGVHEMIGSLPEGYDTVLQERGVGLSTGQRQGIALARALVTNPKILILDEATSAMDYASEQRFQERFADICKGRTTIVVAHRLSTVRNADRIIALEKGQIVEDGSPEALLEQKGRFYELYHIHQSLWSNT